MSASRTNNRNASLGFLAFGFALVLAGIFLFTRGEAGETSDSETEAPSVSTDAATLSLPDRGTNREVVNRSDVELVEPESLPAERVAAVDHAAILLRVLFVFADDHAPVPDVSGELAVYFRDGAARKFGFRADLNGVYALHDFGNPVAGLKVTAGTEMRTFEFIESEGPGDCVMELERMVRVSGQVLTSSGEVAGGAEVLVVNRSQVEVVQTDGAGRFEILHVPRESEIFARHKAWIGSEAYVVRTKKRAIVDLELRLRSGEAFVLEGRVSDESDAAVAHARIELAPLESGKTLRRGWRQSSRVETLVIYTDASGAYRILGVPKGSGFLSVYAPGFAFHGEAISIRVDREYDIQLGGGVAVSGRVVEEPLAGALPTPIADAKVYAYPLDGNYRRGFRAAAEARTNSNGDFLLRGVGPGRLLLEVGSPLGRARLEVEVAPGEALSGLVVEVPIAQIVEGVVTSESGLPLVGWIVGIGTSPGLWDRNTDTDANGAFRLVLPPSETLWRLEVNAPDLWQFELMQGPQRAEELGGLIVVAQEKIPSAFLVGKLFVGDSVARDPIIGLFLDTETGPKQLPISWGEHDGSFRVGPLIPGQYRVRLIGKDALSMTIDSVDVQPNRDRDLGDLHLDPAASLRIEIEGNAIPNETHIRIYRVEDTTAVVLLSGMDSGLFEVSQFAPGDYLVELFLANKRIAAANFTAVVGMEAHVVLTLAD